MLLFIDKPAGVDLSDKPILEDLKRCETPKIVTESDLKETKDDFQNLMFNHETEVGVFAALDLRGIQIVISSHHIGFSGFFTPYQQNSS